MSRGALIYANNNESIDYVKLAALNAKMINYNLGVGTTLVSDKDSMESDSSKELSKYFEKVILTDDVFAENNRVYQDSTSAKEILTFKNTNHWSAYDLSPYEETIFIDSDYLVMSDVLNNCWGSINDIMINHDATDLANQSGYHRHYVSPLTLKMYWATCIYFRKSPAARMLFDVVKVIHDKYDFYKENYLLERPMFRNDYAFSIALHILNNSSDGHLSSPLPNTSILTSFDTDELYSFNDINDITLLHKYIKDKKRYLTSRVRNCDVHVMNKFSILRHYDKIMEMYE